MDAKRAPNEGRLRADSQLLNLTRRPLTTLSLQGVGLALAEGLHLEGPDLVLNRRSAGKLSEAALMREGKGRHSGENRRTAAPHACGRRPARSVQAVFATHFCVGAPAASAESCRQSVDRQFCSARHFLSRAAVKERKAAAIGSSLALCHAAIR